MARAEEAIRTLRDVEGASVQGEGDTIHEIHVLSRSNRPAKRIVRDVLAVLQTRFNRSVDYRIVSVAYLDPESHAGALNANGSSRAADPVPQVAPAREPEPPPSAARVAERQLEMTPEPPTLAAKPPSADAEAVAERIRFGGVNLFVSGPRTQAEVELVWQGLARLGGATGLSTRSGAHRLIAQATLAAVQEFLVDELALAVQEVEFLRLGKRRAVVVSLSMLVGRQEKMLIGSCTVEQDSQQAVVFATLAALNRLVAGLRPKEPTEYVLRPTSAQ